MITGKRWPWYMLLIVVGVTGIRLAWRLSVSETGWAPHLMQWVDVAYGLVGIDRPKLGDQSPVEQATFWLHEMKRLGPADNDPRIAMGAAWMLDAPQLGFVRRHVRAREGGDVPGMPAGWRSELDWEAIAAKADEFERLCRRVCLAETERAVRLDETNVESQRARALLLFQRETMGFEAVPRQDDWLSALNECAQADADNALYDYLAALHLWELAATYDWQEDGYVLNVTDNGRFAEGDARLAAGLAKPYLRFGMDGYAATFDFLQRTSVSRADYLTAAGSRPIESRASGLLYQILRWGLVQSDVQRRAGQLDAAVDAARHVLTISEQITEAGNYAGLLTPKLILRQSGLANLDDLHHEHPDLLSSDEAAEVSRKLAEVQREIAIHQEVGRRMAARAGTSVTQVSPGNIVATVQQNLFSALLMVAAQVLVIVCVVLAIMAWLAAHLWSEIDRADHEPLGWSRHAIAWALAFALSFVALGWKNSAGTGLDAQEMQRATRMGDATWAFVQWQAHYGPVVAPVLAVVILVSWHVVRRARLTTGGLKQVLQFQKRSALGTAGTFVAGSSFVAAIVAMSVYFVATTSVADTLDTYHRVHYARMARPAETWKEMSELTAEIRADKETMARLQIEIDERNRRIAAQEAHEQDEY